jgi:hypothetical protein
MRYQFSGGMQCKLLLLDAGADPTLRTSDSSLLEYVVRYGNLVRIPDSALCYIANSVRTH